MQVRPVFSALSRHKAGVALIALQIALTLAIVCNALFIIHQRVARLSRPSGVDEAHVLVIQNQWVGEGDSRRWRSLMDADLATLRGVPGVAEVSATNAVPLGAGGWSKGLRHSVDQRTASATTAIYFADASTLASWGLHLVAGRNFHAEEIGEMQARDRLAPRVIIITRTLAEKLFPAGAALGKTICVGSAPPSVIVGIVDRLQTWNGSFSNAWMEQSTLVPFRLLANTTTYVLHVQGRAVSDVAQAAPAALFAANPLRVIGPKDVQVFAQIRADAYRSDHGMAVLMGVICAVLLATTAAGIVGLTSFWVSQRRRHIGVRRALGATRADIVRYFCIENLLISAGGVVLGSMLALGLNGLLVEQFAMARLSIGYLLAGVAVLLMLGQSAVLVPALRASRLSPVEATRCA